ncbi:hypothetical protein ON010_g13854 [Phytophthora cinnamomi]|nr:hypothetical protein ON010_g13854 [Phytophthora cinnamomi]
MAAKSSNNLAHVDRDGLAHLAHDDEVVEVAGQSLRERGQHGVLDLVLLAHVDDDRRDSGVVVLRDAGEEVVGHLVVECAREERREERAVAVVHRRLDLRDGPLVIDSGNLLVTARVLAGRGDVADLEVEGQVPARHELGQEEDAPEARRVHLQHDQRDVDAVERPEGLGQDHLDPVADRVRVHAQRAVRERDECLEDVLHAELEAEHAVQRRQVQVLELVDGQQHLAVHNAAHVALEVHREVGVRASHVRVDVVADHVLVEPRHHVGAGDPVHREASNESPARGAAGDGGVRRVVHHVEQRQRLAHAEERTPGVVGVDVVREQLIHAQVRDGAEHGDDHHAPHARVRAARVQLVVLEVLVHALAALLVEPRVGLVLRELGAAHELAHGVLGQDLVGAVGEGVVRVERVGALAARVQQHELAAARVTVRPFWWCEQ